VAGAGRDAVSAVSYGYLKRVPRADVALGVMAYQLASSTQAAVASADRGRVLATQDLEHQGRWELGDGMVGRYTRGESAGSVLRYHL
jgi:hypothetical protein